LSELNNFLASLPHLESADGCWWTEDL
jgi:hypothetical protein